MAIGMYASNNRLKDIAYFIFAKTKQPMRTPCNGSWARVQNIFSVNLYFLHVKHFFSFRLLRYFHLHKQVLKFTTSIHGS